MFVMSVDVEIEKEHNSNISIIIVAPESMVPTTPHYRLYSPHGDMCTACTVLCGQEGFSRGRIAKSGWLGESWKSPAGTGVRRNSHEASLASMLAR